MRGKGECVGVIREHGQAMHVRCFRGAHAVHVRCYMQYTCTVHVQLTFAQLSQGDAHAAPPPFVR